MLTNFDISKPPTFSSLVTRETDSSQVEFHNWLMMEMLLGTIAPPFSKCLLKRQENLYRVYCKN